MQHFRRSSTCAMFVFLCASAPLVVASDAAAPADPAPSSSSAITYDVMSIKPNKTSSGNVDVYSRGDSFSATNVSLKQLLEDVYDIKQDLISGLSGPIESARFDIEAKIVDPDRAALKKMTPEQERVMLLPLLNERFQLKLHTETKILPVYDLVVLPGGPKFKPSATQTDHGGGSTSINGSRTSTKLTAHDLPMTSLAKRLAGAVHRTVIDKTGLSGNFDLAMEWSNEDNPDSGAESFPDVFTAVQEQLGLKLQPSKGPVETLVVDHAEMPSEN
jgi:uncharacterized protein (TIGR03435 family)